MLLEVAEEAGLATRREGFADRAYDPDGTLVPRDRPGAVLGCEDAARQAVDLAGSVDSICVHSDSTDAAEVGRGVRTALERAGIRVLPFATG